MNIETIIAEFSLNRLNGEPVPKDVQSFLAHRDAFWSRTGIELNWEKGWEPWMDKSYLTPENLADRGIAANSKAIDEVCGMIAFVAAHEDCNYYGYWRGVKGRSVAESSIVYCDNEGQFGG